MTLSSGRMVSPLALHVAQRQANHPCRVVGIMSGTSLDGIDIVVVTLRGSGAEELRVESIDGFTTVPIDPYVRQLIQDLLRNCTTSADTRHPLELVCTLNAAWARFVAVEVNTFLSTLTLDRQLMICGSHGQTLWHQGHRAPPFSTLQLGDGEVLARSCGMVTVSNFRNSDIAVGGCGAPLVPYFDRILAAEVQRGCGDASVHTVALQNLGGIGNVTCFIPDDSHPSGSRCVAFDTGPANVVLNEFVEQCFSWWKTRSHSHSDYFCDAVWRPLARIEHANDENPPPGEDFALSYFCDHNGRFSSQGAVRTDWLHEWISLHREYLDRPPPKSTGREMFGADFVKANVLPKLWTSSLNGVEIGDSVDFLDESTARVLVQQFYDVCRTAVELTAVTVALSYEQHLGGCHPEVVAVSGGGALNPTMMAAIRGALTRITPTSNVRVAPLSHFVTVCNTSSNRSACLLDDAKEAIAFAVLAHEKLNEIAGVFRGDGTNVTSATGAHRGAVLGQLHVPTL